MSVDLMDHIFRSLEKHFPSAIPNEPQQPRNRISSAPVEGLSPTAGIGTADAGTLAQYRQAIYAHERLIEKLYDLARADRFDELHDAIRAEYLSIHGPRG